MSRRKLVAANWKMNGSRSANTAWLTQFAQERPTCETVVCAPFVYLPQVVAGLAAKPPLAVDELIAGKIDIFELVKRLQIASAL